ncbi:glycosyltransferase family 8 protein [Streptococcus sp. E29BA]|uniref:glycosyltransferase family 8 protein n=1 Tax=Streptococcus sp. E29BA TaxID=3278716 RepID=UPI00359E8CCF
MRPVLNLLFSINDSYVDQFKVTLFSLVQQTPDRDLHVYLLQQPRLSREPEVEVFCRKLGVSYHALVIDKGAFADAPTSDRYPETIYYRLLAHEYLPDDLDKILYLDADILCINPVTALYDLDLGEQLYAAASHTEDANVTDVVNRLRLGDYESKNYFNSGVLLMNLTKIRQMVKREDIMTYIAARQNLLFLPDQDVLTALYGHHITLIPDQIYNFDTRYHLIYAAKSLGKWDLDWVMANTVFLHFCGRDKPWKPSYRNMFSGLYKHYQHLTRRADRD